MSGTSTTNASEYSGRCSRRLWAATTSPHRRSADGTSTSITRTTSRKVRPTYEWLFTQCPECSYLVEWGGGANLFRDDPIGNRFVSFPSGILHKGDGTNIYLKERSRKVVTVLGNGRPRRADCRGCDGKADEGRLTAPVALASGRDGSLYIGDYNFIRKLNANREDVTSILQLKYVRNGGQNHVETISVLTTSAVTNYFVTNHLGAKPFRCSPFRLLPNRYPAFRYRCFGTEMQKFSPAISTCGLV